MAETSYRPADPSTTTAGSFQAGAANPDTPVLVGGSGSVELQAQGDSSNIDIKLVPKGTGVTDITGTITPDAIVGGDSSLGITGQASAASVTGGAVVIAGGVAASGNAAGGVVSATGGAGVGNQAGGIGSVAGGVGGATGAGGKAKVTGGAGGATSGAGGAVEITGGAGTNGSAVGGSVIIAAGAGNGSGANGNIIERGTLLKSQGAPTAKTVSATLTAAEVLVGIITINQGAAGASAQQLPVCADMDTALPDAATGDAFDFSVINISTVAAEDASLTTNTGWTLVGNMDIASNAAATDKSAGRFRARKTGTALWTLYRLS